MLALVTGSMRFVGSTIVQELLSAGHQVLGLARFDESAKSLTAAGVSVQRSSLNDLDSLKSGAVASDGVIHTAFIHDFTDHEGVCKTDRLVVEAIGSALQDSGKPFIITTGTLGLKLASVPSEALTLAMASTDVRAMVMRLPPTVHGDGDKGFVPRLISIAREKDVSGYIGDGLNKWPAVHRLDIAGAYRLAIEKDAAGSRFHAVADEGTPFKEIATMIGKHINVPVASTTAEEAPGYFGFLVFAVSGDVPTSSIRTQEQLGWSPSHIGFIPDLELFQTQDEVASDALAGSK